MSLRRPSTLAVVASVETSKAETARLPLVSEVTKWMGPVWAARLAEEARPVRV